jgi:SAM-dependent methyltransferase
MGSDRIPAMARDRASHWDQRYGAGPTAVSWYQPNASLSVELMDTVGRTQRTSVLDVGGGASTLVDDLLARGQRDVTVLDVSAVALNAARDRLGDPPTVTWITHDLLTWSPRRRWDLWHDRAVLHFLVDDHDRDAYVAQLRRALEPDGTFVIGTFAEDGPSHCSGLPVRRYAAADLVALLGDVHVVERRRAVHQTPAGVDQPFTWVAGSLVA